MSEIDDDPRYEALLEDLGFCSCGLPEEAMRYVLSGLELVDERKQGGPLAFDAAQRFYTAISDRERGIFVSDGSRYFFWYWLDHQGLTEHGGSVPGWLSEKGMKVMADLTSLLADHPEEA